MQQRIAQLALVVKDYDEAIAFYRDKLLFSLVEDTVLSETKRWVVMAPPGNSITYLLLAKAANEKQLASVGNQTGGRVFLFLHTDDLQRDYERMKAAGVNFVREPSVEVFGKVAVFEDLYGTLWDMIEPATPEF
ncbi:catechol 2,3-dioxygenase-like lactoylglutathione lyase family enzyme [Lacibacter cauensis]|uniref:Catechol 2,3-dioxygenase-like lactoylglutathione lyase family enzyme n=1 Tax=Lacibacter cauensis TaxID=510947 RepID=A0A562SUN8_9BACT|nr:VOC family protein [Lacibacter cauensis]TWI85037.1 catechol 2,3-dioxygenase-like lactoylglutathione lyase family enzyme [Lacibacter cauensis]